MKPKPTQWRFENEDDFKMVRALYDAVVKLAVSAGARRKLVNAVMTGTTNFAQATEAVRPALRQRKLAAARSALERAVGLLAELEIGTQSADVSHARRIAQALLTSGPRIKGNETVFT